MYKHTFEVPLYVEPSQHFKRFLKNLGNPFSKQCMVSYWQNQEKLTFSSKELDDEKERKASVVPISSDLSVSKRRQLERNVSSFASKFNSSMALRGNDLEMSMELVNISQEDVNHYGNALKSVLRLTIVSKSLAKEIALKNFFMVIDSSTR